MDMDIKNMAVTALLPYEKNTKAHPEDQVARIAASIKEFGFNQPVLVDGSGVLVAGHGRVMAAQALGMETVPTICVDHLTPEQVRAYRIADNKTAESAWIDDVLRGELEELRAEGYDLGLTGFDEKEIDKLLSMEGGDDGIPDDMYENQYGVIIACVSEAVQEKTFNRLSKMGHDCKVVV
jgi:ParB-like chromosome segregation protein Spo0J